MTNNFQPYIPFLKTIYKPRSITYTFKNDAEFMLDAYDKNKAFGLITNTKAHNTQHQDNIYTQYYTATSTGDLFTGISVEDDQLSHILSIQIDLNGQPTAVLDPDYIQNNIKQLKVYDKTNNETERINMIKIFDSPIPISCLTFCQCRLTIKSTTPIKYLYQCHVLLGIHDRHTLLKKSYSVHYAISQNSYVNVRIGYGLATPDSTENFGENVDINKVLTIQRMWRAKKRIQKLKLLKEIKETAEILLYKPNNLGYLGLKDKYSLIMCG
jgi:hypothetical protein